MSVDTSFIPDTPTHPGPLNDFRRKAAFDWKMLRIHFEGEASLRVKYSIWERLEKDPLFKRPSSTLTVDEQKKLAAMRMKRVVEIGFLSNEIKNYSYHKRLKFMMSQNEAFHAFCPSLSVKMALGIGLFCNALIGLGSERHRRIYDAALNGEIVTAIAITEVSHGSNTKRIRTLAIYDKETKEFVINTPDFEAAKCWVGNLGKTASMVLLFANLITSDGENQGLHAFLVPVRDPQTLKSYKGIVIGDIGEKIGLNGIDNGFVMFNNYRIPKENLLNRTGDVNEDGAYESVFSEPSKILGAALESLSAGRIGIMHESSNTISHAVVIAVRYAAIRKQFGPDRNGAEISIIDYPLHQWRIFPYLAAACVMKVAVHALSDVYLNTIEKSQAETNGFEVLTQIVSELHALVSSSKPMFTWLARDAIQEARESCGGHGYLKAANIGELRNNHDATVTYEGDNNVLGQQTSNWLLKQWNGEVESPLGTVNFLKYREKILRSNFSQVKELSSFDIILKCYEWLLCHLMEQTNKHINKAKSDGANAFTAKNISQVYKARTLSVAFAEYYALCSFKKKLEAEQTINSLKPVLEKIFLIYGFWNIDKHLSYFYIGGFSQGAEFSEFVRSGLVKACGDIKDSAVSIADALSPPDFVLNSILGKSDGKLYDNLKEEFFNNDGALEVPLWADEIAMKSPLSSKSRSRSRSRSGDESREKKKSKKHREKDRERRHRNRKSAERERSYHTDSSDVVEVPIAPEPPIISKKAPVVSNTSKPSRSPSPVPAEGAGDVLSIEETNKLRAKLGLKPLEVGPSVTASANSRNDDNEEKDEATADLKKVKDDWGEFYHKPAGQFNEKSEVEKLREKIQAKRDKRKIEQKLARFKTLGESDSDDDPEKWVEKNRKIAEEKKKAAQRAKMFESMDQEMDVDQTEVLRREPKKRAYREKDLKGLKVAHDIESFTEDRQVILTLKDQDVLGEDGDTLVNVNMIENERYKKNVEVRKKNPLHYGYDVYEEQYDEFGNFIDRSVLGKYDDEIDGNKSKTFTLGESKELMQENQRRAMEIKAKLQNKTLENLNVEPLRLASDHYTEEELAKFKKPKKKIKKIRQKLKADDLLEIAGDATELDKDLGSRKKRLRADELPPLPDDIPDVKVEADDEDLEHVLSKARRLKQKNSVIKKTIELDEMKTEIKMETEGSDEEAIVFNDGGHITLNQTAEFCRTLGDIPTYGMAGNRDDNADIMDIEENSDNENEEERRRGKWNTVDPNDEPKLLEGVQVIDQEDTAILDEEPDVASGVAAALQLAMSKGYIEKEESNRPSNTRFAHLQAQNYSIDDKAHGEDDKYARRSNASERFNGPTSEFREKPGYKPNVKLEYIDDNNQKLTPKEAFRYLSHKFHGKGPGKNKIEKRLKKVEQEVLMKKMSSSDTPLNTLNMLQHKQKETQSAYVVLSGNKSAQIGKNKR